MLRPKLCPFLTSHGCLPCDPLLVVSKKLKVSQLEAHRQREISKLPHAQKSQTIGVIWVDLHVLGCPLHSSSHFLAFFGVHIRRLQKTEGPFSFSMLSDRQVTCTNQNTQTIPAIHLDMFPTAGEGIFQGETSRRETEWLTQQLDCLPTSESSARPFCSDGWEHDLSTFESLNGIFCLSEST